MQYVGQRAALDSEAVQVPAATAASTTIGTVDRQKEREQTHCAEGSRAVQADVKARKRGIYLKAQGDEGLDGGLDRG